MPSAVPRVVIVGGGFGGLAAAKALRKTSAEVILLDGANHHLFQPLLYQVATSVLSPGQIASPIRGILRKQRNVTVLLGDVTGVDTDLYVSNSSWSARPWASMSCPCHSKRLAESPEAAEMSLVRPNLRVAEAEPTLGAPRDRTALRFDRAEAARLRDQTSFRAARPI